MNLQPLLTIAIPTFNRAKFLNKSLQQLNKDIFKFSLSNLEIIISDNASTDKTKDLVNKFITQGMPLKYFRNLKNIGSDANIANCFNKAKGKYVLILGDDDLFIDKGLPELLYILSIGNYGVVCLKPYGYDYNSKKEYPLFSGFNKEFKDPASFLFEIGPLMTFISACVVNKNLIKDINAKNFIGTNLVQVYLVIFASLKGRLNIFIRNYLIACKRNNSGGYFFPKVFVENLGNVLDYFINKGLTKIDIANIEWKLIISFYPLYLFKHRFYKDEDIDKSLSIYNKRYSGRLIYYLWLFPIIKAPRFIALLWGIFTIILGRLINGDLALGMTLIYIKLKRFFIKIL